MTACAFPAAAFTLDGALSDVVELPVLPVDPPVPPELPVLLVPLVELVELPGTPLTPDNGLLTPGAEPQELTIREESNIAVNSSEFFMNLPFAL